MKTTSSGSLALIRRKRAKLVSEAGGGGVGHLRSASQVGEWCQSGEQTGAILWGPVRRIWGIRRYGPRCAGEDELLAARSQPARVAERTLIDASALVHGGERETAVRGRLSLLIERACVRAS